ncbi:hypothetical protein Ahy_A03g016275 [Arachis hypogaea]|uniref:Uncharacterized protein n=1 Tax=Arachis hypogaea TaxID=3818 RepID=A0A445E2R0_ARAHY|nr:hypothetical protein Ahy_A03g016275 [Arachis hypogaea]
MTASPKVPLASLLSSSFIHQNSIRSSSSSSPAATTAQLISSIAQPAVGDGEDRSVSCSASKVALTLLSPDHRVHHCRRNLHLLPSFPSLKLFPRRPESKMGGGHGEGTTYKGITIHQPKRWHTVAGKGLCAVMWFWVFYRAKQDGPVVVGGILGRATMIMAMVVDTSRLQLRKGEQQILKSLCLPLVSNVYLIASNKFSSKRRDLFCIIS